MNWTRIAGALLFGLAIAASSADAMPLQQDLEQSSLVQKVQIDCHPDVRRHYLPEYGRSVWHRHRQNNCRVVLADPEFDPRPRDCHRDVRRHYLPQYGRSVYHRHVGESCRIRIYNPYEGNGPRGPSCVKIGIVTVCEGR